ATLDERGRIDDYRLERAILRGKRLHDVEGLALDHLDLESEPLRVARRDLDGGGRGVRERRARAAAGRGQSPRAGIAEDVEDARRPVTGQPRAIVALVVEPPGLLAGADRRREL